MNVGERILAYHARINAAIQPFRIFKPSLQHLTSLCQAYALEVVGTSHTEPDEGEHVLKWCDDFYTWIRTNTNSDAIAVLLSTEEIKTELEQLYSECPIQLQVLGSEITEFSSFHFARVDLSETLDLLGEVVSSEETVKRLLTLRRVEASKLIELLDGVLEIATGEDDIRRRCLDLLRKLCERNESFPRSCTIPARRIKRVSDQPTGSGGNADVWKGEYDETEVALKVVRVYGYRDANQIILKSCFKEAVIWKHLRHRNIARFYGICIAPSEFSLVAQWMSHGTVVAFLECHPIFDRLALIVDVAEGLQYLHDLDIVHGDLKGANILVNGQGVACITDFGLSVVLCYENNSSTASVVQGSLRWMAPEILDPEEFGVERAYLTRESDIHSFSLAMLEIFTGAIPFNDCPRDATVILRVIKGIRPQRPPQTIDGLTDGVWNLMEECWQPDWRKRPDIKRVLEYLNDARRQQQTDATAASTFPLGSGSEPNGSISATAGYNMGPDNARGAESLPPLSVVYGDSSDQDSRPGTPLSEDDDRSDTSDHILEVSPPSPRDVDLCSQCGDTLEIVRYVCSTCGAGASSVDSRSDGTQNVEEQSYQLCSRCVQSPPGLAHALEMGLTRGKSPDPSAENDQLSLSERRRSAPRQKGQLRHAYIEQSWGQNGWQDIEQENSHSVSCSTCGTAVGLHHYRCTSCHAFDLCRACYSRVHEIHPSHAFLVVRPDTGSEVLPSQLTISDELEYMVHVGVKCVHCLGDIIGSRFHCAVCPSVDICSSCELAGLPGNLDSEDGGHNSSHILIKIPYPSNPSELQALNRRSSEQHWLNGAGAESLRANLLPRHNSAVAGTDHGILCASCNLSIQGVRYQCAMCPTSPTAFSLCSRCEERSYIVHDPMHVFFKLPRPVDRPLQSGFRMSAKLYLWPAGPDGGAYDPAYPTGYLAGLAHTYSVCDHCMQRITGIWFHCAFCPVDLCEDCEKFDEHNNTHVFILFKSTVNIQLFNQSFGSDHRVGGRPDVIKYPIYLR